MRPYKKRSFTNIQVQEHNDNNMEIENSEDSDTQESPLSAPENVEKAKEGDMKTRKKWKRKISRKQFRHHNIQLFTPGEYRSSTLLKQKELLASPTLPKIFDVNKVSITDAIVSTLGGVTLQKGAKIKDRMEENNNTNGFQNNNNVGKHQLPAIIMETPTIMRRKSTDNIHALPKTTFIKHPDPMYPIMFNPISMAIDMPTLQTTEETCKVTSSKLLHDVHNDVSSPLQTVMMDDSESALVPPEDFEVRFNGNCDDLPENLSLKRRCSTEVPVDLSKKATSNCLKERVHSEKFQEMFNSQLNLSIKNTYSETMCPKTEQIQRRSAVATPSTNAQQTTQSRQSPDLTYLDNNYSQQEMMESEPVLKTENLEKCMNLLQHSLGQEFNVSMLHLMSQAYQQVEQSLGDLAIYPEMRYKAQKLHEEVYNYITAKMKYELGLEDVDALEVIKILGRSDNNQAKHTLQTNLSEIQRFTNLNLNDSHPPCTPSTIRKPAFSPPNTIDKTHKELTTVSQHAPPDFSQVQLRQRNILSQSHNMFNTTHQMTPSKTSSNSYTMSYPPGLPKHNETRRSITGLVRSRSKSHRNVQQLPGQLTRSLSSPLSVPVVPYLENVYQAPCAILPSSGSAFNGNPIIGGPLQYRTNHFSQEDGSAKFRKSCPAGYPGRFVFSANSTGTVASSATTSNSSKNPNSVSTGNNTTEEKISSTTDHLEVSKRALNANSRYLEVLNQSVQEEPKPRTKTLPAVIVADISMQITKEPSVERTNCKETVAESSLVRTSVITSSSSERSSSSEENFKKSVEDETTPEFVVWLEILKKDEELKSKFLTHMGVIKKEASSHGDYIEIIDSDDEKQETNRSEKKPILLPTRSSALQPSSTTTVKLPREFNRSASLEITPIPTSVVKGPLPPVLKPSLSEINYIPPISLPYSVNPDSYTHKPSVKDQHKNIYNPEFEPISPVSETSFNFPPVLSSPTKAVHSPVDLEMVVREPTTTSPTYAAKRKTPLGLSENYSEAENNRKSSEYSVDNLSKRRKSLDRPQTSISPRVVPLGKLCYIRENNMFLRYFDDTQVELFLKNLSSQDEELLRTTGIDPERIKNSFRPSNFSMDQPAQTEIVHLPSNVEFSKKEDLPDVEEFVKESSLVEQFVPKDFADFYRYVTGFQIIKNKHPVSLKTFLTMYNTNRTAELLRKYLQRLDEDSSGAVTR
ncbi:uncharacterized protein [Euwallacea fornicatus]|uniref:uncharacterized protein isoform X2 n=1 Tax=Euwallacea fornicatus TaxID=995702 RepID=UPI00338D3682